MVDVQVFVYGTLRPGGALNKAWMSEANHIGTTTLPGELFYVCQSYPGYDPRGKGEVVGDLYWMSEHSFKRLAKMETDAGFTVAKHKGIYCFAYLKDITRVPITTGDWMNRPPRKFRAIAVNKDNEIVDTGQWYDDEDEAFSDARSLMAMGMYHMVYLQEWTGADAE